MKDREKLLKKIEVNDLYFDCFGMNPLIDQFFDIESAELLDKKIKILTQIKNGKNAEEIEGFYDILEDYPNGENVIVKW